MSLETFFFILFQATAFTLVWLAVYLKEVHEIRGSRHPFATNNIAFFLINWSSLLSYTVGNAVWLILALTAPSFELVWWYPIVGFLTIGFLATGGGIETARYDLGPNDRRQLNRAVS